MECVGVLHKGGWWDLSIDGEPVASGLVHAMMDKHGQRIRGSILPGLSAWQCCWWILYEHFDHHIASRLALQLEQSLVPPGTVGFAVGTPFVSGWTGNMLQGGAA